MEQTDQTKLLIKIFKYLPCQIFFYFGLPLGMLLFSYCHQHTFLQESFLKTNNQQLIMRDLLFKRHLSSSSILFRVCPVRLLLHCLFSCQVGVSLAIAGLDPLQDILRY